MHRQGQAGRNTEQKAGRSDNSNTVGGTQQQRPDANRKGNIMSALRKIHIEETGYTIEAGRHGVPLTKLQLVTTRPAVETESHLKQIALFAAAPFIGLVYAVLFPFVGLGYLAVLAVRALVAWHAAKRVLKFAGKVALFIAAPFIGLAYIVALPFAGIVTLAWVGTKVLTAR
jgi:hypothetical protein